MNTWIVPRFVIMFVIIMGLLIFFDVAHSSSNTTCTWWYIATFRRNMLLLPSALDVPMPKFPINFLIFIWAALFACHNLLHARYSLDEGSSKSLWNVYQYLPGCSVKTWKVFCKTLFVTHAVCIDGTWIVEFWHRTKITTRRLNSPEYRVKELC